ncbi:hypothetical protein PHET_02192 [Paragonimus heterotremus]|uniref:Uncharacterized protein n=1 Tax=Paragonimus heterotremus TaxID=100268 RepID=A0A8J4TQL2_9TREM|nr:hypothetical protein PHET_02192 [Paragonimus heterotremus]
MQAHGSLLLITGRSFPTDQNREDDEAVEIVNSCSLIYFLFDVTNKHLSKLELTALLPPELRLSVSCRRPAWLPRRSLSQSPTFICSVTSDLCTHNYTSHSQSNPVAALFTVEDLTVSLLRLIFLNSESTELFSIPRISVLPSAISADRQVFPFPQISSDAAKSSAIKNCISHVFFKSRPERYIVVLSSNLLLMWTLEAPESPTPSSSSSSLLPSSSPTSILALIELNHLDCVDTSSNVAPRSAVNLLAYSDQLGDIQSVTGLWLRPRTGPMTSIPIDLEPRFSGYGGVGLEIWVQRTTPKHFGGEIPPLVLLSTRPLCASEIAVAPTVDLASLFSDCYPPVGSVRQRTTDSCHSSAPQLRSTERSVQAYCLERKRCALPVDRSQDARDLRGAASDETCLKDLSNSPSATNVTGNFEMGREISEDWIPGQQWDFIENHSNGSSSSGTCTTQSTLPEMVNSLEMATSSFTCNTFTELVDPALHSNSTRSVEMTDQVNLGLQSENQEVVSVVTPEGSSAFLNERSSFTKTVETGPIEDKCMPPVSELLCNQSVTEEVESSNLSDPLPCSVAHNQINQLSIHDGERAHEATAVTDTWSVYCCPSCATTSIHPEKTDDISSNLLERDDVELIPFVEFNGRAGIAVFHSATSSLEWILSPKSFGLVHSLHVSPDGKLIWCLRKQTKQVSEDTLTTGYAVDVCLERDGLTALLRAWTTGQTGLWESNVLLRVTSLDLQNTHALFSTCSGSVKIQIDLSPCRPYCQSYTWPCPDYHVLQVAVSERGLVWALAVTKHAFAKREEFNGSMEELCLLTASLPGTHSGRPNFSKTPAKITSQLRASHWHPLLLPTLLQPSAQQLMTYLSTSLDSLTQVVNSSFQLAFTTQFSASAEKLNASRKRLSNTTGWMFVRSVTQDHSLNIKTPDGDCDSGVLYGCGYFLPNLCPPYKPDDLHWYQVPVSGFGGSRYTDISLQSLFKRIGRTVPVFEKPSHITPLLRVPTHLVTKVPPDADALSTHASMEETPVTRCSKPMWLVLQRPSNGSTLLARLRSALPAYHWSHHRVHVQTAPRGSPLLTDVVHCQHIWRFPLLVDGLPTSGSCSVWTVNGISNELFCHFGTTYSRSLALPVSRLEPTVEREEVTAVCVVRAKRPGLFHLVIGTRSGQLWSRIGLSELSPVGSTWANEQCPNHWFQRSESGKNYNQGSSGTNFPLLPYFTSLVCVGDELWATDSLGNVCSTEVRLAHKLGSDTSLLLKARWSVFGPSSPPSAKPDPFIFFLSLSGGDWCARGSGISLWATGLPIAEATKLKVSTRLSQATSGGQALWDPIAGYVYARCWNQSDQTFSWFHVSAPLVRSIHVGVEQVWIQSATWPYQMLKRLGLETTTSCAETKHPGPLDSSIGRAWQLIPHPDPLFHKLHVESLALRTSRHSEPRELEAIAISQTGDLLKLCVTGPIVFSQQAKEHMSPDTEELSSIDGAGVVLLSSP